MGRLLRAAGVGMLAGTAGTIAMTVTEKAGQRFTGRPDSQVPGRALARILGISGEPDTRQLAVQNWGMHLTMGTLLGMKRGLMAYGGLRGPWASAMFTVMRLANDQMVENLTGVGAPPWTWPRRELVVDVTHKAVYAFTTGAVADLLAGRDGLPPGEQHAAMRPGRHADVGPVPREHAVARH